MFSKSSVAIKSAYIVSKTILIVQFEYFFYIFFIIAFILLVIEIMEFSSQNSAY